jgi:hypothetical protein
MQEFDSINVLGQKMESCSCQPMTGFFRTGKCDTSYQDKGMHTVCCQMTDRFLNYSKETGNDLSTPKPEFGFPGLQNGDWWCVCAARWYDAYQNGIMAKVNLEATHEETLAIIPIEALKNAASVGPS